MNDDPAIEAYNDTARRIMHHQTMGGFPESTLQENEEKALTALRAAALSRWRTHGLPPCCENLAGKAQTNPPSGSRKLSRPAWPRSPARRPSPPQREASDGKQPVSR